MRNTDKWASKEPIRTDRTESGLVLAEPPSAGKERRISGQVTEERDDCSGLKGAEVKVHQCSPDYVRLDRGERPSGVVEAPHDVRPDVAAGRYAAAHDVGCEVGGGAHTQPGPRRRPAKQLQKRPRRQEKVRSSKPCLISSSNRDGGKDR